MDQTDEEEATGFPQQPLLKLMSCKTACTPLDYKPFPSHIHTSF